MKLSGRFLQNFLWIAIGAILAALLLTSVMTNTTVRSVEKDLPGMLLRQLHDLTHLVEDLTEVVLLAELMHAAPTTTHFNRLREKMSVTHNALIEMRNSYVFDNLVQASAFHSVVAPALADAQLWLSEGVSSQPPEAAITIAIVLSRMSEALRKARALNQDAQIKAERTLSEQRDRLNDFLITANFLFLLIAVIGAAAVYLLIRQYRLQKLQDLAQAERRQAEEALRYRVGIEHLVAQISSQLAAVSADAIDAAINQGLAAIGAFTGADRAYVFLFKNGDRVVDNTHEWCAEGVEPQIERLQNIVVAQELPWFTAQLRSQKVFHVPDVAKLPQEANIEREHFTAQGIQSLITVPMEISGSLGGFLGFDAVREQRLWSGAEQALLRLIGNTFSRLLERKRAEDANRALEAQLRQAQKMEAVGTLAGGIAHEFNNILGIILGNAELAREDIPQSNPAHFNLSEIKTASLRAKEIVRQLLTFGRKTEENRQPVSLVPVIREAIKLLRSSIPANIQFEEDIATDGCCVLADSTQIQQILLNLGANAAHAMETTGGILRFSLHDMTLHHANQKHASGMRSGRYVVLQVSDTGEGIPADIVERIFDPYFTTKEVGKGAGLGLSVVHGIVERHGGWIEVDSKPARGTTFKIFFPAETRLFEPGVDISDQPPTGHERILFVDDEASIAAVWSSILTRLGYQVQAETDPEQALRLFAANPDQFDLLITDMTMPAMRGDQLIKKALLIRPDLKTILCTGYSQQVDETAAIRLGAKAYILKPLDLTQLAVTARKVLDGAAS